MQVEVAARTATSANPIWRRSSLPSWWGRGFQDVIPTDQLDVSGDRAQQAACPRPSPGCRCRSRRCSTRRRSGRRAQGLDRRMAGRDGQLIRPLLPGFYRARRGRRAGRRRALGHDRGGGRAGSGGGAGQSLLSRRDPVHAVAGGAVDAAERRASRCRWRGRWRGARDFPGRALLAAAVSCCRSSCRRWWRSSASSRCMGGRGGSARVLRSRAAALEPEHLWPGRDPDRPCVLQSAAGGAAAAAGLGEHPGGVLAAGGAARHGLA